MTGLDAIVTGLHLIMLHSLDGKPVIVNAEQVTSLRSARPEHKLSSDAARCIVGLTDGKFVVVREPCDTVRQMLEGEP